MNLDSLSFRAFAVTLIGLILVHPVFAQSESEDPADDADDAEVLEDLDIDVQGSLDDVEEKLGIAVYGDLRLGYVFAGEDIQDIVSSDSGYLRSRWRLRSVWGISERFRAVGRVSGICSANECDPDFILQPDIPTKVGLSDGQITIDSLFFSGIELRNSMSL